MINRKTPDDLCPIHTDSWRQWKKVEYNPRTPGEWPDVRGGRGVMDSRTTHAERERDWDRKTSGQLDLIESICRRGDSPQCDWPVS